LGGITHISFPVRGLASVVPGRILVVNLVCLQIVCFRSIVGDAGGKAKTGGQQSSYTQKVFHNIEF